LRLFSLTPFSNVPVLPTVLPGFLSSSRRSCRVGEAAVRSAQLTDSRGTADP
jgi:hypothetical protein